MLVGSGISNGSLGILILSEENCFSIYLPAVGNSLIAVLCTLTFEHLEIE